jgi:hypothetical protein
MRSKKEKVVKSGYRLPGNGFVVIIVWSAMVCLGMISQSHAQSHIGIMAGPSAGTMYGSYIKGTDGLELGFSANLTLDKHLGKDWEIVVGVGWVQKGGKKVQLSGFSSDSTYGFQSSYIEVPIVFRKKFKMTQNEWYIAPLAGLAVGFNGGCSWKEGHRFEFEEEPCDENTPGGEMKKLDLSIPFGVAFWKEFTGGSRFHLELRYELGLLNIFEGAAEAGESAKNGVLVAQFGFSIPLQ